MSIRRRIGDSRARRRVVRFSNRVGTATRFVGRKRELERLRAALASARRESGRLVFVSGEPGIGKTRLVEQFALAAERKGTRGYRGSAWQRSGTPHYWPWTQLFRACLADPDCARMRPSGGSAALLAGIVPELGTEKSTEGSPTGPDTGDAPVDLFAAVCRFWKRAARRAPLVLVLEDLHEADLSSLRLLDYLARDLSGAAIFVLATCRDSQEVREPGAAELLAAISRRAEHLPLEGLSVREVAEFIGEGVGEGFGVAPAVELRRLTGGNPFFLAEVIRAGVSTAPDTGRLRLEGPIPRGVAQLINSRVAPLSPDAKATLEAAAVFRHEPDLETIAALCGSDEVRVRAALDEAISARLIVPTGGGGHFAFRHELVREALLQSLASARRVDLHRRIAELIDTGAGASPERPFAVAHHRFEASEGGGWTAETAAACEAAGRQALGAHAYEEAAREFERALVAVDRLLLDDGRRLEILLLLGEARGLAGERDRAREMFLRAADLARALAAPRALARAAVGLAGGTALDLEADETVVGLLEQALSALGDEDSPLGVRVIGCLAVALHLSRSGPRSEALSEAALAMARRLDDPEAMSHALTARHLVLSGPDHVEERLRLAEALLERAKGRAGSEMSGRFARIVATLELGDLATVDREIRVYERAARRLRAPAYLWQALVFRAMRALLTGRLDEAEQLAEEAFRGSERGTRSTAPLLHFMQLFGIRRAQGRLSELEPPLRAFAFQYPGISAFRPGLALLHAELGRNGEGRAEFERLAERDFADFPRDGNWLNAMEELAEVCACLGDRRRAAILYDLLFPFAERTIVAAFASVCHGPVSRPLALLAATLDRWTDAVRHFERALEQIRGLGAELILAETEVEYARASLRRGDPEGRAPALLDRAARRATALGLDALRGRIEALAAGGPASAEAGGTSTPEAHEDRFRFDGDGWEISFRGRAFRVKDMAGLRYLAILLCSPGRETQATDLGGAADGESHRGDVSGEEAERARVNATRRIRSAIRRIAAHDPALAHYLRTTIRTGGRCIYRPDPSQPIRWTF